MNTNSRRLGVLAFVLTLAVLILTALPTTTRVQATSAAPEAWRIAPPSPKIAEAERLAELAKRRQEAMKRMGDKAILVLFSTEPRIYTYDVDYHYRQENNLYYLTGINQDGAALVLIPGAKKTREILFVPERDPRRETWTGHMLSNDEARKRSGVQEIWDMKLLNSFLATLAPKAEAAIAKRGSAPKPNAELAAQWQSEFQTFIEAAKADQGELYLLTPPNRDLREYRQEYEFAENLKAVNSGLKLKSAHPIFAELRLLKSPWEIKLLQHAADITAEAFHRVFAVASPGMFEYEIQAEFEYTFKRRGADNWGYPCIVGAGANATTLHYITNQEKLADDSLLLMDCAAEFDHYTADITRTLPINGKFTKEQADIYRIVYEAQTASINRVRAGNIVGAVFDPASAKNSVQGVTAEVIKDGLFKLGLITSKENNEFRTWFMHGTSHWIGMNVHDVGDYKTPLAPGMVLTVEPGIYIRPDALDWLPKTPENERFIKAVRPAFEKYKGIGIRIEDDVLVTNGDPVIMSGSIPRKLEDVEATMARLKQELRKSGWPQAAMR
ncbi:MAG TPA: aminopeptidase P N-terminal domain-containing protein [Blastocatellia bacterium]|nr:aminopeptidase P N-terminal domain-containing protein [Blastocatellia bacterium]